MRFAVLVVLLLSLCPMRAGLSREMGGMPGAVQQGQPPQGGKENTGQTSPAPKIEKKPMTNADVISMVKADLALNTIVLAIQLSPTAFDTSPQELISLKNQGVPQEILDVMLTSENKKPTPPAAPVVPAVPTPVSPPSVGPNGRLRVSSLTNNSTKGSEINSRPPDLHSVRKIFLEIEEWGEDDSARPREMKAIEKHTCLKLVDTREAADAILSWETQGLMGAYLELSSKDGQQIWNKRGFTAPLKALNQAVGCP
jgi:hypothetical protein